MPSLAENVVFSNETHFILCVSCFSCLGTGKTQDTNKLYNPTATLEDMKCPECKGTGQKRRYMTLETLLDTLAPAVFERFMEHLPEIIARSKLAVVESVMES
jgi:hypothetical protein